VPVPPVMTQSAVEAFELILNCAGAVLPRRDSVDARVVEEVRSGEATYGVGIVNSPQDVGGWPELRSEPAPADSDGDGMPDVWERERGYDPNDAADGNEDFNRDGYTNLEDYLNELAEPAFPEGYLDSWRTKW